MLVMMVVTVVEMVVYGGAAGFGGNGVRSRLRVGQCGCYHSKGARTYHIPTRC